MTSGNKKQFTLFQSWSKGATKSKPVKSPTKSTDILEVMDSDDDEDLARALEESMRDYKLQEQRSNPSTLNRQIGADAPSTSGTFKHPNNFYHNQSNNSPKKFPESDVNLKSYSDVPSKFNRAPSTSNPRSETHERAKLQNLNASPSKIKHPTDNIQPVVDSELPGFDMESGRTWIYPTNYPVREYQFRIVEKALYTNTMVVLPTGLGKTFIAAVIMYNFYRWYPGGKIVFMAPTKPLVSQQIEACFKIMGIPQSDTVSMTGSVNPTSRGDHWTRGRVFFLTPQVLNNDLSRGICPARKIRCLIVDEAHKALGNYAYCQVVQELSNYTDQFRIVALSATPGSDIETVQQVLKNLLISEVDLRSEDSPDIQPYTHERAIDKMVVPLGDELKALIDSFSKVMTVYVDRLSRRGAMNHRSPTGLSKYIVLKVKEAFCQNPTAQLTKEQFGQIQTDFSMLITLCHSYELLLLHGIRSFYRFLKGVLDGDRGQARTRLELLRNPDFEDIFSSLRQKFQNEAFSKNSLNTSRILEDPESIQEDFVYGHPKLQKLEEIVVEHFRKCQADNGPDGYKNTRVMIFSQYRDSVEEIKEMLERRRPLVRVMSFVGQGSTTGANKGLSQKMQMKVVQDFKGGGFNTLVSTCVGEEGLDIGEVDLIVCYDAPKSPIRLVQRMGRTGRRRQGRIVVLLAQGKEEQMYNQSLYRKRSIHKAICSGNRFKDLNSASPRMVPRGLNPVCHKMYMTVGEYENVKKTTGKVTGKGKNTKKGEILSAKELQHWRENLKMSQEDVPVLPASTFLSIQQEPSCPTPQQRRPEKARPTLSLTNWVPWQSGFQEAQVSGHSWRSKNFVEIMQLMQLQGNLEGDDDPYGMEMSVYLQQNDILLPGQKDNYTRDDITSYFKGNAKRKKTCHIEVGGKKLKKNAMGSDDDNMQNLCGEEEDLGDVVMVKSVSKKRKACAWFDSDDDNDFVDEFGGVDTGAKEEPDVVILDDEDLCDDIVETVSKSDNGDHLCNAHIVETVSNVPDLVEQKVPSIIFIKPPPDDDINWNLFSMQKISSDEIKEIATNNLYMPDPEVVLSPCSSVEFYEVAKNVLEKPSCEVTNGMTDSILNDGLDGNLEDVLNGLNDNISRVIGQESKERSGYEARNEMQKPSMLLSTPTKNKTTKLEDSEDDGFDSDSDIVLSGIDTDSLMDYEMPNNAKTECASKNSPTKCKNVLKPFVPITPPKLSSPLKINPNVRETLSPDMNPKTSTPKSILPTRKYQKLPENSPITPKRRDDIVTFKTPISKPPFSPLKSSPTTSVRKPSFNDSSVLFDDTSEQQDTRCNITGSVSRPKVAVSRAENTQDLLTVTQMIELLNKTYRENQKQAENAKQITRTPTKPSETKKDVPVFDFGLDFSGLDDNFSNDCDIPNQKSQIRDPTSQRTNCNASRLGTKCSETPEQENVNRPNCVVNNSKCVEKSNDFVSAFDFGIDFDAFDQPFEEEDIAPEKSSSFRIQPSIFLDPSKRKEQTDSKTEHNQRENNKLSANSGGPAQSPITPNGRFRSGYSANSSSDGDVLQPVTKKRARVIEDDGSSSSSLWGSSVPRHRKTESRKKKKDERKKRTKTKTDLIQDEAEISGYASSDDEDTSMDSYDRSFVDDREPLTQNVSYQVDMQAMYLRSVMSPSAGGARSKFKLQYGAGHGRNVYSQVEREPMESYIEDSFCVNNEQVEYTDSTEAEAVTPAKAKKVRDQKLPKRRILPIVSSSEDEDVRSPVKTDLSILNRPSTSALHGFEKSSSSSKFTTLKTPPRRAAAPLSRFDLSCQKLLSSPEKPLPTAFTNQLSSVLHSALRECKIQSPLKPDVLTLFVDTRELSGGQAVISQLRSKHAVQVIAQQLAGNADYQVGTQVGVLRMTPKALSIVLNKAKVIEKVQNLRDFYDRPFLVVEKEKGSEKSTSMFRNRALDTVLFNLLQTDVTVLYSSNQGETSHILLDLCQAELTRGNGIIPGDCNSPAMQFYTNLPYVNTAAALNFSRSFKYISSFLKSSATEIGEHGHISHNKATKIFNFVRLLFL